MQYYFLHLAPNTASYKWPPMQYYLTGTDAAWLDLARSLLAPPHIHSGFLPTFLLVPSPCSTLSKADYGHVRPAQVWQRVILPNLCKYDGQYIYVLSSIFEPLPPFIIVGYAVR